MEDNNLVINNLTPDYAVCFYDGDSEIGRLDWTEGELRFSGKMEESAEKFFDFLKPCVDQYIQSKLG